MSFKTRRAIAKCISEFLRTDLKSHNQLLAAIPKQLELKIDNCYQPELHLPISSITKNCNLFENDVNRIENISTEMKFDQSKINGMSLRSNVKSRVPSIIFHLKPDIFFEECVKQSIAVNTSDDDKKKNIVVEFSSPNIAKPFHVGHLRSTIIGNFIANFYKFLGNNVTKLNYLGDWGTQFGLLQIGLDLMEITDENLEKSPINTLLQAYVYANQLAEKDTTINEKARKIFRNLECGELKDISRWIKIREYTIRELSQMYDRLGIQFDKFDWESQYNQKDIEKVLQQLETSGLIHHENDGRKSAQFGDRRVPLIKSDGSTLYLIRDIAALLDRFQRYKFDKIYYVVDNGQTDHFNACFNIAHNLNETFVNKTEHIKFGRIKGMSTRQGNVIFLKDILDEARTIMTEKQIQSPTTKIDIKCSDMNTADILGISAVIINDLKQRRQRDYDFLWEKALQVNGDTGIKLQYTHCRLCSLIEKNNNINSAEYLKLNLLQELEAKKLIIEISRFPEILLKTEESLESCIMANYLFSLSNTTSRALKILKIKNESNPDIQSQRLTLFETSKVILNKGMTILGLKPLDKM